MWCSLCLEKILPKNVMQMQIWGRFPIKILNISYPVSQCLINLGHCWNHPTTALYSMAGRRPEFWPENDCFPLKIGHFFVVLRSTLCFGDNIENLIQKMSKFLKYKTIYSANAQRTSAVSFRQSARSFEVIHIILFPLQIRHLLVLIFFVVHFPMHFFFVFVWFFEFCPRFL